MNTRSKAAAVVAAIAAKLEDPQHVAAITDRPENAMVLSDRVRPPWSPPALSDGFPAVALLFSELAASDPGQRRRAHAYLAEGLAGPAPHLVPWLYGGPAGLAFAAHTAAVGSGGYSTLLSTLDRTIVELARRRILADNERLAAGQTIGAWSGYDVVSGATGFGRYLLGRFQVGRDEAVGQTLEEVLRLLVRIATVDDIRTGRPRWWVDHDVNADPVATTGHLNLGLAHGVAGPLALLALAARAGVRVERQEEAMVRIADLLLDLRSSDAAGPFWPYWIMDGPQEQPVRTRDGWCYGAAGIARALYLAGTVTGQSVWQSVARAALDAAIDTASNTAFRDYALCHGWAGLLQIVSRMAQETGDEHYTAATHSLAETITSGFDPGAAFGYHYSHAVAPDGLDRPGLLEGAAGIALALHTHATGEPPRTDWDAALLLN